MLGTRTTDDTALPSEDEDASFGAHRGVFVLLAVVPALTHLTRLLTLDPPWRFSLYEDDAFYYLGVARNLADGHGSTFSGLLETNGYHPLWTLLLAGLARVLHDPDALLVGLALLQGALWALSVREALRIGRAVGAWRVAVGAVAVYGVLAVLTGHLAFNGMESALVMPLLLLLVRLAVEADDRPRTDLRLGVVLALVCLARLDAVVAAVPLGLVLLARGRAPADARLRGDPGDVGDGSPMPLVGRAMRLAGPPALALGAYMAVNVALFGTATPVSGRAKGLGAPFFNTEPLTQFLRAGTFDRRSLWFGVVALGLVVWAWWAGRRRGDRRVRRLVACMLALVAGQAALLAYLVFATSYRVWPWYHYLVAVFAFLAAVVVGRDLAGRDIAGHDLAGRDLAGRDLSGRDLAGRAGVVVGRLCLGLAVVFLVGQVAVVFRGQSPPYAESVSAAAFVREELPADAVLAMGDRAGIFGFLAERPLLHLEGLVADATYLDDLEAGRGSARMAAEGVDYYVSYGHEGVPLPIGERSCHRFVEPIQGHGPRLDVVVCDDDRVFVDGDGSDRLQIWRFRPELNQG